MAMASGVAVYVEATTDNKNRTTAEVRHIFSKYNGSLGEGGCVAWMFERKGMLYVPKSSCTEDAIVDAALEAGAEDIDTEDDEFFYIRTEVDQLHEVKGALEAACFKPESPELVMEAKNTVSLDAETAGKVLRLVEMLEESDDVSNVSSNADITDEIMEKLSK